MPVGRSQRRTRLAVVALFVATLAAACAKNAPTAPTAAGLTGPWASTDGRYRWTLVQSGSSVTGEEIDVETGQRTAIAGKLDGQQFSYTIVTRQTETEFTPGQPIKVDWGYSLFADVSGDRMTGHFSSFGIPGAYPRAWYYVTIVRVDHAR